MVRPAKVRSAVAMVVLTIVMSSVPALADTRAWNDERDDVYMNDGMDTWHSWHRMPKFDVRRVRASYSTRRLRVSAKMGALRSGDWFDYCRSEHFWINTDHDGAPEFRLSHVAKGDAYAGCDRYVTTFKRVARRVQGRGTSVACRRKHVAYDAARDLVVGRVPASCLGRPSSVQVSLRFWAWTDAFARSWWDDVPDFRNWSPRVPM